MQFRIRDNFMTKIVLVGINDFQRDQNNFCKTTYNKSIVDGNEYGHSRNYFIY